MPARRSLRTLFIIAIVFTGVVQSATGRGRRIPHKHLQLRPINPTFQPLMAQLRRAYSTLSVARFLTVSIKRQMENSSSHTRF
jgi:hypothetical protein